MANACKAVFSAMIFLFGFLVCVVGAANAEKRVALVIGNSAYTTVPKLITPQNDAIAIGAALSGLGFEVITGLDLDERQMLRTFNDFNRRVANADVALLFYAGHGLQVDGTNYLVPTDASLESEFDLQAQAMRLQLILNMMEHPSRTSIVLLDACRDNPMAKRLSRTMGTRSNSVGRGFARVSTGVGTYIGFSTEPGNVALDGDGDHSPFADALLKNITKENLDIESIMRLVRAEVYEKTRGTQTPWGNSSLIGKGFIFNKSDANLGAKQSNNLELNSGSQTVTRKNGASADIAYWNWVKESNSKEYFQSYIEQFPHGIFVALAKLEIRKLDRQTQKKTILSSSQNGNSTQIINSKNNDDVVIARLESENESSFSKEKIVDRSLITELQQKLYNLNFKPGKIDGLIGTKTRLAIARYQSDIGREETGFATMGILTLLRNTPIPDNWGGLGFNISNKRVYNKNRLSSRQETQLIISKNCNGCGNILIFSGEECGAHAMSDNGWGWAVRKGKAETEIAAINACSIYGGTCKIQKLTCANGT